jgi:hypothetical protein
MIRVHVLPLGLGDDGVPVLVAGAAGEDRHLDPYGGDVVVATDAAPVDPGDFAVGNRDVLAREGDVLGV